MGAAGEGLEKQSKTFRAVEHVKGFAAQRKGCKQVAIDTINVHVVHSGGEACTVNVNPSAKLFDVMIAIHQQLGHTPHTQRLVLGETLLADANANLKDIGVTDGSTLGLVVCGPIDQNAPVFFL